nr:4'-phosphopantetheinyl transferase [uncultured bacterium]
MDRLLPAVVACAEAFDDPPDEPCFPGEEDLIAGAVPGRRREFITARRCARDALGRLGHPPAPIRPGPKREPLWPDGVVGSITHCAGYRAAAVARTAEVASVGIDAETHDPLPEGVYGLVAVPDERPMLDDLAAADNGVHWGRLLFSAKESVYKAWYPLTGRWLGFEEARLTIDRAAGVFTASILVDGARADAGPPLRVMAGRYLVRDGLVLTAVSVPVAG